MRPLEGIQLLSLAVNIPGPVAVSRLCHMGAVAVKIEPPGGDVLAIASPDWYATLHEGVTVHRLDLKSEVGQARLDALLSQSDVLLTATRPAALKRLGLGWPSLGERYPRLCHVAIIGHPPPNEGVPGHDLTYLAALGLLEPPGLPRTVMADLAGAEWAVETALALLLARERAVGAGRGATEFERYTQVALADAAAAFAEPLRRGLTKANGLLGGGYPGYNLYETCEGWVAVAALEPHFLQRLADELALAEVTQAGLAEAFLSSPAAEWEQWAAERDLPIAAVIQGANDV